MSKTLYRRLVDAGFGELINHYQSDLYVVVTPETTKIIYEWLKENNYNEKLFINAFTDQITGRRTYDVPFNYDPWWKEKCRAKTEGQHLKIGVMLDEGAKMPTKAHEWDAGFDLYTTKEFCVPAHGCAVVDTGVHIQIPEGYVGFLKSKSGLNVKKHLISEGVIDAGYTGSIVVKLRNTGDTDHNFLAGDKITQLVILPIPSVELFLTDKFDETERGFGGFGSTGR